MMHDDDGLIALLYRLAGRWIYADHAKELKRAAEKLSWLEIENERLRERLKKKEGRE